MFVQIKRAFFGDSGLLLLDLENKYFRITSVQIGKYKIPSIKQSDSKEASKILVSGIKAKQSKNNRRIKAPRGKEISY